MVQKMRKDVKLFTDLVTRFTCSWLSSRSGEHRPLNRRDLTNFLDADDVERRLNELADDGSSSVGDKAKAKELLKAMDQGRSNV